MTSSPGRHDGLEPGQPAGSKQRVRIVELDGERRTGHSDEVATEEPMEIRVEAGRARQTVAVTMRTPGSDFELAAGFLLAEGIVQTPGQVRQVAYCTEDDLAPDQRYNTVTVALRAEALPDLRSLERNFYVSSACGVCGRTSLDALKARLPSTPGSRCELSPDVITRLPGRLRAAQRLFDRTGGLHAAALFGMDGDLVVVREDVGRHNAVDKVTGWALLAGRLPLSEHILLVSGRSSFEIVQKASMAGIAVVCSISAPSSLAITTATQIGMTLVGFLRGPRFNVYAGADRLADRRPA